MSRLLKRTFTPSMHLRSVSHLQRSQEHILRAHSLQLSRRHPWPQQHTSFGRTTVAYFHSTPRNEGGPLIPFLAVLLKTSTALEVARTAGRIAMTFVPIIMFKTIKGRHKIKWLDKHNTPEAEEKKSRILRAVRQHTNLIRFMFLIPITLFFATIIASLEQTPLTGRWRLIILSPEEEDDIALQLAGPGWYNAVGEILSHDGPPKLIPRSDWRYTWLHNTLRQLESTIPVLVREREVFQSWLESGPDNTPMPPPADYPLRPRPRAVESLRNLCERLCDRNAPPAPHTIPGPPYSLLLVDKPDASNAFSYGFGPDGGGGIVVYSGFIDDILSRHPQPPCPEVKKSWLSGLSDLFFGSSQKSQQPTPTPEQTSDLAVLLAHELAHLVLSHHLETLSSSTVIIPGTISIIADVVRVLIFPITMLFGPFVNDGVAHLGKFGSGEISKMGEYCTNVAQEVEADVVSARLLAYAGYDARNAVRFWEERTANRSDCSNLGEPYADHSNLTLRIMGTSHPVNEVRVEKLKQELVRWEMERQAALARLQRSLKVTPSTTVQ